MAKCTCRFGVSRACPTHGRKKEVRATNPIPTQQETLMPCPFCGGKAEETVSNGRGWLGCLSCHIGNTFNPPYGQRERETWNTRCRPRGDAFTAYNQAIEDAKQAIREERVANPCEAPSYINAIARKCSPHRYVASLHAAPAERTEGEQGKPMNVNGLLHACANADDRRQVGLIFSTPQEADRFVNAIVHAAAPADNDAESLELLRTAAVLCVSGDGQPRVSLLFKELKDAQAVHGWLVRLVHKGGR